MVGAADGADGGSAAGGAGALQAATAVSRAAAAARVACERNHRATVCLLATRSRTQDGTTYPSAVSPGQPQRAERRTAGRTRSHLVDRMIWLLGPAGAVYAELDHVEPAGGRTDCRFAVSLTHAGGVRPSSRPTETGGKK